MMHQSKDIRRWLITGGCGFIGTSLVKSLLSNAPKDRITILDNLSVGTREDLGQICRFSDSGREGAGRDPLDIKVRLIVGDIRNFEDCMQACEGATHVLHLAANTGVGPSVEDPRTDMCTNVEGTFNMLDAARRSSISRFIFASSGAPIGECTPPIHEKMPCRPVSPYGASKLAGEAYCSAFFRSYGLETICLRFGNVYGPGSWKKNSVVAKFIKQAIKGETLEIFGDGEQTRDFIYIEDLTRAIFSAAASAQAPGEIYQIATSREHTLNELVDVMLPIMEDAGIQNVRVIHGRCRQGDVRRNFSDTSKARGELDWEVEVDLRNGIKRTVDWFAGCP